MSTPATATKQPEMNDDERAIQAHADSRPFVEVPLRAIFPRARTEARVKIRALVLGEKLDATAGAVARRKAVLTSLPPQYIGHFLDDPTFLKDSQSVEELARAVRNAEDPTRPAFTNADSMHRLATDDELATLFAYYEMARRRGCDVERVDHGSAQRLAEVVVESPEAGREVLMRVPKHELVDLFGLLAERVVALQAAAAEAAAKVDAPG